MKIEATQTPWQPSCWVGGLFVTSKLVGDNWLNTDAQPIINMPDDSRAKYAAVKATAAILKAMRK
jgi:hypothetical protein